MSKFIITKVSKQSDVVAWLKERGLDDIVSEFQANEIDGEDFFNFEFEEISRLIPRFKLRKRFLAAWSEVTGEAFDGNGLRCPSKVPSCSPYTCLEPNIEDESPLLSLPPQGSKSNPMINHSTNDYEDDVSDISETFPMCSSPSDSPTARKSLEFETPNEPDLRRSPRKHKHSSCVSYSISPKRQKSETVAAKKSDWLSTFCIPTRWEPDVENGLRNGKLTPLQGCALIRQLCTSIMAHTSYPTIEERTHIALQLVMKYPFLKGSFGAGHQIWEKKIQTRFANIKKRVAMQEKKHLEAEGVVVIKSKPGRKKKQVKKKAIPSIPAGETELTMNEHQRKLLELHRKGNPDYTKVKLLMDNTYPKRRREVLLENVRVWKLLQDYPFLKDNKGIQIKAELGRIEEKNNISKEIRESWELKKPQIMEALKKTHCRAVKNIMSKLDDCEVSDERELENRCIMAALPHVLGEKNTHKHTTGEHFLDVVLDDSEVASKIRNCSTPRLLATGPLEEMSSIALIAEGMCDYEQKMEEVLADSTKFQQLEEDLVKATLRRESQVKNLLKNLKASESIDQGTYNESYPTGSRIGILYGLPPFSVHSQLCSG